MSSKTVGVISPFSTSSSSMAEGLEKSGSPLLQQAVDNYRRQCGTVGDLKDYQQLSLDGLLEDTARLEQRARYSIHTRPSGIATRLQGLITFVDRYAPAMDCLVQTCSGSLINPAALVWGLLRILLEVASSASRYFPNLLALLDELNSTVSIYNSYEEIFFQHPKFQYALVEVYSDIISILDKARRILTQRSKWKLLLRSLKTNFEIDFKDHIDLLRRHLTVLESETTLAHRMEMHSFAAESRAGLARSTGESSKIDTKERIFKWLAPVDCDARFREIESVRHPGSCSWLFENKEYLNWKLSDTKPLLWISGPPGIGKTILSSAIFTDIQATSQAADCIAIFSCDANDRPSTLMDVLFGSIIAQIATKVQPEHLVHGLPQCLINAWQKSARFGRKSLSKSDLPQYILSDMAVLLRRTWVIIDGLDEMMEPERVRELLDIASALGPSFRLAVLSRATSTIKKTLGHLSQIEIENSDVQGDISRYIEARSKELPLDNDKIRQNLSQAVNSKSEGMFLWARLIMADLSTATCQADMEQILLQYPVGLSGVYDRFLEGIASQAIHRQRLAQNILQWVCCACRPLRIDDLASALSSTYSDSWVNDENGARPSRSAILDVCSPFFVLNSTLDTLRPVHQSFREYLIGPKTPQITNEAEKFLIQPETAHKHLALRCIRYLQTRHIFLVGSSGSSDDFLDYAMTHWCQHTISGSYSEELECGIHRLMSTADKRQRWLNWMLFGHHGSPLSLSHVFRLQRELRDWAGPSKRDDSLKQLTRKEWNMDCLELLIKATRRREGLSKLGETYFGIMAVARDLVRGLKHDGQTYEAITRLQDLRTVLENCGVLSELGFVHNLLGMLHDQEGHSTPALQAHQTAQSIQESSDTTNNSGILWTMNEIARMYRHIGLLGDSERIHRQVLDQLAADLPEDHPELIWTINTLATTLRKQNRASEALRLHMRAYHSRSKSLGELHAHSLWSCGDVAKCYQSQGLFTDAIIWYQKAFDGRVKTLGHGHPDTLWSMNHLGLILADLDRVYEAIDVQKKALESQKTILGPDHPHTCWTRTTVDDLEEKIERSSVFR